MKKLLVGTVLVLVCAAKTAPAGATQPGRCTLMAELSDDAMISTEPVRVCSIEFFATANNGWAQVFDAANATQTRSTISEPGAASSGNHTFIDFGDAGFVTQFGLGVNVVGGRVLIRWGR